MIRVLLTFIICISVFSSPVWGQNKVKILREAVDYLFKHHGDDLTEETVETLSQKLGQYSSKYGNEAIEAIKTTGPRAFKLIDDAGENAPEVIRLLNKVGNDAVWVVSKPSKLAIFIKYGDEAAEAMIKHPGVGEDLIEDFGLPAAQAIKNVSGQNARRLVMMSNEGSLAATGRADDILNIVGQYGDRAADWVWRNKKVLATGTVAVAFVANPEPFLDGTMEVISIAGETIVRPVAEKVAEVSNWSIIIPCGVLFVTVWMTYRYGWRWLLPRRKGTSASNSSPTTGEE